MTWVGNKDRTNQLSQKTSIFQASGILLIQPYASFNEPHHVISQPRASAHITNIIIYSRKYNYEY